MVMRYDNHQCFYRDTFSRNAAIQGERPEPAHETQLSHTGRQPGISIPRDIIVVIIIIIIFIMMIIIIIIAKHVLVFPTHPPWN